MSDGLSPQVATKNKTAKPVQWKVPGILGGNAVPGWEDQQGSIVRRIVLVLFDVPVIDVDTQLHNKLAAELPSIMLKANRAYHWAVRMVGERSIWARGVLPEYFHRTKDNMAETVNSMRGFLGSEMCKFQEEFYCPLPEVRDSWQRWMRDRNINPKPRWTPDLYKGPLEARGLRLEKGRKSYPRVATGCGRKTGEWVMGMDLTANMEEEDEENRDPNSQ